MSLQSIFKGGGGGGNWRQAAPAQSRNKRASGGGISAICTREACLAPIGWSYDHTATHASFPLPATLRPCVYDHTVLVRGLCARANGSGDARRGGSSRQTTTPRSRTTGDRLP